MLIPFIHHLTRLRPQVFALQKIETEIREGENKKGNHASELLIALVRCGIF